MRCSRFNEEDNHRVVKDSQDHSHREQACRCAVSVVHLGWADPVPGVVTTEVPCKVTCQSDNPVNTTLRKGSRELVAMFRQLSCRDVASCQHRVLLVVAAEERREERTE